MVEISYLPPEAGKLPWTVGGLELLQVLQKESEKWIGDNEPHHNRCGKLDCYFCALTKPIIRKSIPEFIMSGESFVKTSAHPEAWTEQELSILDQHLPISVMVDLLPGRTKGAIFDKRRLYRAKLGLPLLPRGGKEKAGHF